MTKAERLYEKYRYLMFSEANKILHDSHLAEDAVHQAFIKIMNNLHKIDEENVPATRSFLVIICKNVAINIYNSRQYLNNNAEDIENLELPSTQMSPEDIAIEKDSIQRIANAINELPEIYRAAVILKHYHNYNREEIAQILDVPFETVKKRLHRAKKLLEVSLERRESHG